MNQKVDLDLDGKAEHLKVGNNGTGHDKGIFEIRNHRAKLIASRKKWGNYKTDFLIVDLNGNKFPEILIGENQDSSIHIFQYNKSSRKIKETFALNFGGYSGQGSTPSLHAVDLNNNRKKELLVGLGGHCSYLMGTGIYSPGYGWVFFADHPGGVAAISSFKKKRRSKPTVLMTTADGKLYIGNFNFPKRPVLKTNYYAKN